MKGINEMEIVKKVYDGAMRIVVRVADVVELARRFEEAPGLAMLEVVGHVRDALVETLEHVMKAELDIFLGKEQGIRNKRNGFILRTFGIKGLGTVRLRVPRDRGGRFSSHVVPAHRRYDEATEKDLALLNLAGLSTRTLAQMSGRLLGISVSAQEVSNALHKLVPAAKAFLSRRLDKRQWMYLYVDGTNFRVRRSTVDIEPTLVVLGVDETGRKSVLSMIQGDRDSRSAWDAVFVDLKERGLDPMAVQAGIMDGLPGLGDSFLQAFPKAKVLRCWVHKARNVMPRVPRRYQAAFQASWNTVSYANSLEDARIALDELKRTWGKEACDAVSCLERDVEALLAHYEFPRGHWDALRTTNPIERVNKEFKRRSKSMEVVSGEGLKTLLAFTAIRLEYGWAQTPITSTKLLTLKGREQRDRQLENLEESLLN
jgi:putative transposase